MDRHSPKWFVDRDAHILEFYPITIRVEQFAGAWFVSCGTMFKQYPLRSITLDSAKSESIKLLALRFQGISELLNNLAAEQRAETK